MKPGSHTPARRSLRRPSSAAGRPDDDNERSFNRIAARIAVLGAVAGGLWTGFQFGYKEWLEPRLKPALVQSSVSSKLVGETSCCLAYEIETRMENKGKREVIIHASHQTIGARRLMPLMSLEDTKTVTQKFVKSRMPQGGNWSYLEDHNSQYVAVAPVSPPVLLAAGNPVKPGAYLSEGEVHIHRAVAFVPKDYPLLFVRGVMHVSHVRGKALHWHWIIEPDGLMPQALPWLAEKDDDFAEKTKCLSTSACANSVRHEVRRLQDEYTKNDGLNYSMVWAGDFAAVALKNEAAQ